MKLDRQDMTTVYVFAVLAMMAAGPATLGTFVDGKLVGEPDYVGTIPIDLPGDADETEILPSGFDAFTE